MMRGLTLTSRAIAFAACAGIVAFALSLISLPAFAAGLGTVGRALIVAIACAALCWASTRRALLGTAQALDATIARVGAAAEGDLTSPVPRQVAATLPQLARALTSMLAQVRSNLDSATTLALFDPVTSLANRTHFKQEAERLLRTLGDGETAALAFIDLDHFKAVNDTYGHARGDQVLAKIAARLRSIAAAETLRHGDGTEAIVGRLAGDEFTIVFPHVVDRADAERLGAAILAAMVKPIEIADQLLVVGASIGLAMAREHGETLTQLMRAADVAMYHAKACGRNQVQFYAEPMAERMAQRSRLEVDLRAALARDEFTVVYQPQIALADDAVLAVEGLLRWNHPVDGLRLPASFIPCAEESGLIHDIGDWSIEALAKRAAAWARAGRSPRIAVNLSPRQIVRPEFFARLNGALARYETPLHVLEFEVSESILMSCDAARLEALAALRRGGARIAIDDFGTGSSSLARLRSLPFDTVKLDSALIAGIEHDRAARDVVQAVIGLVHSLGARAVAEEVESHAQLEILRVMRCDAAQGYAIAAPMDEAALGRWLEKNSSRMAA